MKSRKEKKNSKKRQTFPHVVCVRHRLRWRLCNFMPHRSCANSYRKVLWHAKTHPSRCVYISMCHGRQNWGAPGGRTDGNKYDEATKSYRREKWNTFLDAYGRGSGYANTVWFGEFRVKAPKKKPSATTRTPYCTHTFMYVSHNWLRPKLYQIHRPQR